MMEISRLSQRIFLTGLQDGKDLLDALLALMFIKCVLFVKLIIMFIRQILLSCHYLSENLLCHKKIL